MIDSMEFSPRFESGFSWDDNFIKMSGNHLMRKYMLEFISQFDVQGWEGSEERGKIIVFYQPFYSDRPGCFHQRELIQVFPNILLHSPTDIGGAIMYHVEVAEVALPYLILLSCNRVVGYPVFSKRHACMAKRAFVTVRLRWSTNR